MITDNATGSFRKASNRVWDAYPEYLISAFGLHLDLQLRQNNDLVSKDLKVHNWVWVIVKQLFNIDRVETKRGNLSSNIKQTMFINCYLRVICFQVRNRGEVIDKAHRTSVLYISQISHVTHISENETQIHHEPYENVSQLLGCFYTGHVKGDDQSKVSVSLCDGMVSTPNHK